MRLSLKTRPTEEIGVARLSGELDLAVAGGLRADLLTALHRSGHGLVIDMAEVEFMDCSAIGVLVAIRRRAELMDRPLYLAAVPPRIRRILKLVELENAFSYVDDPAGVDLE